MTSHLLHQLSPQCFPNNIPESVKVQSRVLPVQLVGGEITFQIIVVAVERLRHVRGDVRVTASEDNVDHVSRERSYKSGSDRNGKITLIFPIAA